MRAAWSLLALPLLVGATGLGERDCRDCPPMATVPAGRLVMTVPLDRVDGPPTGPAVAVPTTDVAVTIAHPFRIGRAEITVAQYRAFARATGRTDAGRCFVFETIEPSGRPRFGWHDGAGWQAPGYAQDDAYPATCIRWVDADAYAAWLSAHSGRSFRLPTEAEWEYAAHWGEAAQPPRGPICRYANGADRSLKRAYPGLAAHADCDDGAVFATRVGRYRPNRLGLHDMRGNLWEWTADCDHRSYAGLPTDGSAWTAAGDCTRRVRRGGSWFRAEGDDRSSLPIGDAHGNAGFRVVEVLAAQARVSVMVKRVLEPRAGLP